MVSKITLKYAEVISSYNLKVLEISNISFYLHFATFLTQKS